MGNKTTVIIVAGGTGERMGAGVPKQFLDICGEPVIVRTVEKFNHALPGSRIIVAMHPDHIDRWKELAGIYFPGTDLGMVAGGTNRYESVKNALSSARDAGIIMVHDAVRPLVSTSLIRSCHAAAIAHGTAIPVVKPVDSLRMQTGAGMRRVDRNKYRAVQTPQAFRSDIIFKAYGQPYRDQFTDDATVVEAAGFALAFCDGEESNIKITTQFDLTVARTYVRSGKWND